MRVEVVPEPTAEEAAAIAAAVQVSLSGGGGAPVEPVSSRWRFSGRWWSKPVPARRNRPS